MKTDGTINVSDRNTLRETYDRYYRPLCFFCLRYVDDIAEAEDVVQDLFVRLVERRATFVNPSALGPYLYRSAHNMIVNRTTFAGIRRRHHSAIARQMETGADDAEADAAASAVEDDLLWEIMSAIDALPTECSRIFRMSYIEKADINEVARRLNISPHTVKSQRARAKKLLKERLRELYPLCVLLFISP
jgi:RNA polymerase sigma-70 factor (ECF subfamily)